MRNTHFIGMQPNAQDALRLTHIPPMMPTMKTGERIRQIRQSKEMTLSEVEARAGLAEGNLSRVERGLQWVSEEKLYALADALGVRVVDFFIPEESRTDDQSLNLVNEPREEYQVGPDVTVDEMMELFNAYRLASPKDREAVMNSANTAAQRALRRRAASAGDKSQDGTS